MREPNKGDVRGKADVPFRRHALTLQMHTAHILSAHASLEQKSKMIQDLKEQKNKCVLWRVNSSLEADERQA